MKIYYIGSFPPVYGGVTIKNKNLYEALNGKLDIRRIDMNRVKRGNIREMLRFVWAMLTGRQYIIGLAGQHNRRQFTKIFYRFKRKAMARSVLLVMGGRVDDVIDAGAGFIQMFNAYRKVYVELPGMQKKLADAGVTNCGVYPNGRPRPAELAISERGDGPLKCLFFSIIQQEKGVDLIINAAQQLSYMEFHFYGEIKKEYEQTFLEHVCRMDNVTYHGVFSGNSDAVYRELSCYDVLLLPTRWKAEGLPGILVEAKIAGIPAVVSDHNFNQEIVQHGVDGVVIGEVTEEKLANILKELDADREKLLAMRIRSRESAEAYYIDVCAADIIRELERG